MDNDDLAGRRQPILLLPEGEHVRSVIEQKSELPPYTNSKINEMLNGNGTAGVGDEEFLATVRTSIVACLFGRDDHNRIITDEQRGLTTTIVDTEVWPKEEKRIETAIRLFPGILLEKFDGYYPIQWLAMTEGSDGIYNLKNVSLIPLVTELGFDLQQFDEELRGGLLNLYPNHVWNTLQHIICYSTNNNDDNKLRDDCFSTVRNWMMKNNYLVTEDIQRYNLVGTLLAWDQEFVSESRLRYLLDMDPLPLSMPCHPQQGNWLPLHWSAQQVDLRTFSLLVKVGIQYFPKKFGVVFCHGTHRNNIGTLFRGTPFELACDKYGQRTVMKLVMDCIQEYCHSAANNNRETSLLMAAITDPFIHRDALYLLVRNDPTTALSKVQQQVLRVEEEDDRPTGSTDTTTHSHDNNSNCATDTLAAATVSSATASTTTTTTTTVSSPPPATAPTS